MDLHTVVVGFRLQGATLTLIYKSAQDAKAVYDALKIPTLSAADRARGLAELDYDSRVEVTDDFGNTATINRDDIMLHWVSEVEKDADGKGEIALANARTNASLNRRAAADPLLQNNGMGLIQQPVGGRRQ